MVWAVGDNSVHSVSVCDRLSKVINSLIFCRALSHEYNAAGLHVYITGDGPDVYEDALFRTAKKGKGVFEPTLILAGIRLGIDRITPVYWESLKAALEMPHSVGIAGYVALPRLPL
jgi:Peptidase family C54